MKLCPSAQKNNERVSLRRAERAGVVSVDNKKIDGHLGGENKLIQLRELMKWLEGELL